MLTELEQRANDEARHAHRELVEKLEEYRMVASALEIQWVQELERANATEAKLAKAVELVERAFNEGVGEGMNDVLRQSGGKTWYDSRSRNRLAELTGGKDE